jgi:pimeloyl-ACP methyl ester carboxylesterase
MEDLASLFVPSILAKSASKHLINHAIKSMENISIDSYRKVIACLVTFNRFHDFSKINIPCCLIAGSEDNNAPSKTMEKMSKKLAFCQFYNIPNTGHLVNLEAPNETNRIILEFLKNID